MQGTRTVFRKTILPTFVALGLLVVFNFGLYTRLSAVPVVPTVELPYSDTFEEAAALNFPRLGGDWDIRDETLVQISTTGFDLGLFIPVEIPAEQPYRFTSEMQHLGGTVGGGLIFNSQNGRNRQQSHMTRFNVDEDKLWVIFGYFGDDSNFQGQGSVGLDIAPDNADWQQLGVRVNETTYDIILNGDIVAPDVPLQYQGGAVGLITSASQVAFDNVELVASVDEIPSVEENVQSVEAEAEVEISEVIEADEAIFMDGEPLLTDSFDVTGGGASLWLPFGGQWEFADSAFIQRQVDGFDFAAGYNNPYGDAVVSTTFRHLEGQGGGLLFNMAQPDSLRDSHMVRYVHDAEFLMWGSFDADGRFEGQGSVEIIPPADATITLSVIINAETYSVMLNDELVAVNLPITAQGDYHGLVSAQSEVAFDDFRVSTGTLETPEIEPEATEAAQSGDLNLRAVSGDWEFGEVIVQRATDPVDYIAGTGIAAETFRASVTVDLPDDIDDGGAGLVFHMAGRDDLANGQMVRFGLGGNEIFWGNYDADGVFEGLGSTPLELDWSQPQRLTLAVSATTYNILIGDEVLVQDIPVTGEFGWIALVSFRGETIFSDFELSMGQ